MNTIVQLTDKFPDLWFLSSVILGNSLVTYISAVILFVVLWIIINLLKIHVVRKYQNNQSDWFIYRLLRNIPSYFFWTLYIYPPLNVLDFGWYYSRGLDIILMIVLITTVIKLVSFALMYFSRKTLVEKGQVEETTFQLFEMIITIGLYVLGLLMFLTNIWVEISPLLASLGIFWLAMWLAMQRMLADLFASISIYIDRPFKVGDTISLGSDSWVVTHIGLKTTRIKTPAGGELIVNNWELMNSRIHNLSSIPKKTPSFVLNVSYESPQEVFESMESIIKKTFEKISNVSLQDVIIASITWSVQYQITYEIQEDKANLSHQIYVALLKDLRNSGVILK